MHNVGQHSTNEITVFVIREMNERFDFENVSGL